MRGPNVDRSIMVRIRCPTRRHVVATGRGRNVQWHELGSQGGLQVLVIKKYLCRNIIILRPQKYLYLQHFSFNFFILFYYA